MPTLSFVCPVHLGRRIGGLLPPSHANGQASSSSIPSQCRLRLPATISRPVSILKVAPRSVLESSRQLRGQRRPNVCTSPTPHLLDRPSSKSDAMVPRTLSKWLLVCRLNISQPALMSVLEISHQSASSVLPLYNLT